MILAVKGHFDSAHFLPNHKGKCSRMHGHTWYVRVSISVSSFVDFKTLKDSLSSVLELLDHTVLNNILDDPTAENIVLYILDNLWSKIEDIQVNSLMVSVKEGEGGEATSELNAFLKGGIKL